MPEWLDLHLRLEGRQEWVILVPVLAAVVYLVYQRTRPPVGRARRWQLVALRSLTLALLAVLLAEPVLGFWGKQVRRPGVVLLVDTSPSMALEEEAGHFVQQGSLAVAAPQQALMNTGNQRDGDKALRRP